MKLTIWGEPVGKPRQTRRDRWKVRRPVARYRAWCDGAELSMIISHPGARNCVPVRIAVRAFFTIPRSRRGDVEPGSAYRQKPDCDNVLKAVADALWKRDEGIAHASIESYWDDGRGARVEVEWGL